jgi:integrase
MADAKSRPRLTTKLIKDTPPPATGAIILWDGDLPGFGLRISAGDVRTFFLNYRIGGSERRIKIGRLPQWVCEDVRLPKGLSPQEIDERAERSNNAREVAQALRRRVDKGEDPQEQKRERREAPTVADLIARYRNDHMPGLALDEPGRRNDELRKLAIVETALGSRTPVAEVHFGDIEAMHKKITARGRSVRANRILALASAMFGLARKPLAGENKAWLEGRNPCEGIKKNRECGKERFFSERELAAIHDALTTLSGQAADCIRLIMLTGCRPAEAAKSKWAEFDSEPGFWIKPPTNTKQRRVHRAPLAPPALELLERMRVTRDRDETRVFPPRQGGSRINLRPIWLMVRDRASVALWADGAPPIAELVADLYAGLARTPSVRECREEAGRRGVKLPTALLDGRLYDLRHSFASTGAGSGLSLPVIGRLLGHANPSATQRYAHLADDPLRRAADQIGSTIANAGKGGSEADNVETMRKRFGK